MIIIKRHHNVMFNRLQTISLEIIESGWLVLEKSFVELNGET